jgi:hypothetical protein
MKMILALLRYARNLLQRHTKKTDRQKLIVEEDEIIFYHI